jgi:hypothetical protein
MIEMPVIMPMKACLLFARKYRAAIKSSKRMLAFGHQLQPDRIITTARAGVRSRIIKAFNTECAENGR